MFVCPASFWPPLYHWQSKGGVPETVTVDEDRLFHIAQGPAPYGDTDADQYQADSGPRYGTRPSMPSGTSLRSSTPSWA